MVVILRNTKSGHYKRNFWLDFKTFSHSLLLFCGKFSPRFFTFGGVQITPGELILFPDSPTETSIKQHSYTATSFSSYEVLPIFGQTANKFVAQIHRNLLFIMIFHESIATLWKRIKIQNCDMSKESTGFFLMECVYQAFPHSCDWVKVSENIAWLYVGAAFPWLVLSEELCSQRRLTTCTWMSVPSWYGCVHLFLSKLPFLNST